MKILGSTAFALTLLLSAEAHAAPIATTSPGKNAVHVFDTGVLNGTGDAPSAASGSILKGKAKTVVEIQATFTIYPNAAIVGSYLNVSVNSVSARGSTVGQCDSTSSSACTLTGTFWLDVDGAEIIAPGQFVGQPLVITVSGGNNANAGSGVAYDATFTARMGKK